MTVVNNLGVKLLEDCYTVMLSLSARGEKEIICIMCRTSHLLWGQAILQQLDLAQHFEFSVIPMHRYIFMSMHTHTQHILCNVKKHSQINSFQRCACDTQVIPPLHELDHAEGEPQ